MDLGELIKFYEKHDPDVAMYEGSDSNKNGSGSSNKNLANGVEDISEQVFEGKTKKCNLIGHHLRLEGHDEKLGAMLKHFTRFNGPKLRVGAMQIFVTSINKKSKHIVSNFEDPNDITALRDFCRAHKIRLYVHSSYKVVLCGNHPHYSYHLALKELRLASKLGAIGYVVHLPNDTNENIVAFFRGLAQKVAQKGLGGGVSTNKRPIPVIYLEPVPFSTTKKGQPVKGALADNKAFLDPYRLHRLYKATNKIDGLKFGLCVDTAHIWAMGGDISSRAKADQYFGECEKALSGARLLIHLNDQAFDFGSGKDKHAPLGHGTMWSTYKGALGKSGLKSVLDFAIKTGAPCILERNAHQEIDGLEPGNDTIQLDYNKISDLI